MSVKSRKRQMIGNWSSDDQVAAERGPFRLSWFEGNEATMPNKSLQPTATALRRGMSAGNFRSVTPVACASGAPSLLTSLCRESCSVAAAEL